MCTPNFIGLGKPKEKCEICKKIKDEDEIVLKDYNIYKKNICYDCLIKKNKK